MTVPSVSSKAVLGLNGGVLLSRVQVCVQASEETKRITAAKTRREFMFVGPFLEWRCFELTGFRVVRFWVVRVRGGRSEAAATRTSGAGGGCSYQSIPIVDSRFGPKVKFNLQAQATWE